MVTLNAARVIDVDESSNARHPHELLLECCELNNALRFQMVHHDDAASGIFLGAGSKRLDLQVSHEEDRETLRVGAITCVSFIYHTYYCAFLGRLLDVFEPAMGEQRVVVPVPAQIMVTNLRRLYRVPVVPEAGLQAVVRNARGHLFPGLPKDIAEGGIEIEFQADELPPLSVGAQVVVELRYQGKVIERLAEVRRTDGQRFGFLFRNTDQPVDHHQTAFMHQLVMSLQQLWLRTRTV